MLSQLQGLRDELLFFFSSRRRHTTSLRDWSSDVCSSDLLKNWSATGVLYLSVARGMPTVPATSGKTTWRSEERRVGKECWFRGVADRLSMGMVGSGRAAARAPRD